MHRDDMRKFESLERDVRQLFDVVAALDKRIDNLIEMIYKDIINEAKRKNS